MLGDGPSGVLSVRQQYDSASAVCVYRGGSAGRTISALVGVGEVVALSKNHYSRATKVRPPSRRRSCPRLWLDATSKANTEASANGADYNQEATDEQCLSHSQSLNMAQIAFDDTAGRSPAVACVPSNREHGRVTTVTSGG